MFAIIEVGGQQFKVEKGTVIEVGQLPEKEGSAIELNNVLLLNDNGKISVGTPLLTGAFASAKVLAHRKGEKVTIFKMKSKKRYRRTRGHRQSLTKLEITDIKATGGKTPEKKVVKTEAPKVTKAPAVKKTAKETKPKTTAVKKPTTKKPAAKKTAKKEA